MVFANFQYPPKAKPAPLQNRGSSARILALIYIMQIVTILFTLCKLVDDQKLILSHLHQFRWRLMRCARYSMTCERNNDVFLLQRNSLQDHSVIIIYRHVYNYVETRDFSEQ
jgi:hypothetical protein